MMDAREEAAREAMRAEAFKERAEKFPEVHQTLLEQAQAQTEMDALEQQVQDIPDVKDVERAWVELKNDVRMLPADSLPFFGDFRKMAIDAVNALMYPGRLPGYRKRNVKMVRDSLNIWLAYRSRLKNADPALFDRLEEKAGEIALRAERLEQLVSALPEEQVDELISLNERI